MLATMFALTAWRLVVDAAGALGTFVATGARLSFGLSNGAQPTDCEHFCNCESFSKIGIRIERVKEEGPELARAFAEPREKAASKYMMRSIQIIEGPYQEGWEAKTEAESIIREVLAPQ